MEATFIHSDHLSGYTPQSSYFRIAGPAQALRAAGHTIHLMQGGTLQPVGSMAEEGSMIDFSKITETVLLEREASPDLISKLRYAGARRIVLTFDDNYTRLPEHAPRSGYWNYPGRLSNWRLALRMIDLVIVAGPALVNEFRPGTRAIQCVPNYLDPAIWNYKVDFNFNRLSGPVIIGWGGSKEHTSTWKGSPVIEALIRIRARHPVGLKFVFVGHVADSYLDRAGLDYERQDGVDFPDWKNVVDQFDIGLAPLRGDYDNYRSSLKVLEYASLGIPWVATDAPPYASAGGGILVPADRRETDRWEQALLLLLEDTRYANRLAGDGRHWASQFTLDRCVPIYEEVLWPTRS